MTNDETACITLSNIQLDRVQGVLIDLDDTLYSYQQTHPVALEACQQYYEKQYGVFSGFKACYRKKRNYITTMLKGQGACRSRLFAFQLMFEERALSEPYQIALEFESLYWQTLINVASPFPDAVAFLKRCKEMGKKVCVVSDMQAAVQVRKLQKMELTKYIDYMVTSEEAGFEKPEPQIFELALKKLGMLASQVMMVGDSYEKDIKGALELDICAYQVDFTSL